MKHRRKAAIKLGFASNAIEIDGELTLKKDGVEIQLTPEQEIEVNTLAAQLESEFDSEDYARKRKKDYDALNQFELFYDDQENNTDNWFQAIKAIKEKYPKPR